MTAPVRGALWGVLAGALWTLTTACGGGDAAPAATSESQPPTEVTVVERWISEGDTASDVDTPAYWQGQDRGQSQNQGRVITTAKGTHELRVFDAATGAVLPSMGGPGTGPGRFQRPNAVVVAGDLALVVERDNHRIQVLRLPEGSSSGIFGEDVLVKPYGVAVGGSLPELTLWITDDYDIPDGVEPDYTRRVHRFRVRFDDDGTPHVTEHTAFGDAEGPGALHVVETIGVDAANNRLLVADELQRAYLVYDTAGHYQARAPLAEGRITGDPEGLALVACQGGAGYWIATDQQPDVSWFRVFRRGDLSYVGSFRGTLTANTDGVTFAPGEVPGLGGPAFFAVHDDQAVSAFAWNDVAAALSLTAGCGR